MTKPKKDKKILKLFLSIFLDAVGYLSYSIPGIAEFTDVAWAPISAWLMTRMYKGTSGKVGAVISFVEEALPMTDAIPTFTLMWLYTYVFSSTKSKEKEDENIIDITDMQD